MNPNNIDVYARLNALKKSVSSDDIACFIGSARSKVFVESLYTLAQYADCTATRKEFLDSIYENFGSTETSFWRSRDGLLQFGLINIDHTGEMSISLTERGAKFTLRILQAVNNMLS